MTGQSGLHRGAPSRYQRPMRGTIRTGIGLTGAALLLAGAAARAEELAFPARPGADGLPGLVDMPSGLSAPDGTLALTFTHDPDRLRAALSFQATPRLAVALGYAETPDLAGDDRFDRGLSLAYRLTDEGPVLPAITIGVTDLLGGGAAGGEYIAATRHLTPELRVTGGIGWGRFAGRDGFDNPLSAVSDRFDTRAEPESAEGGVPRFDQLFTGPAAVFAGLEWQATDELTLVAEYSSDALGRSEEETGPPINLGLDYRYGDRLHVAARYRHGDGIGAQLSYVLGPGAGRDGRDLGAAPPAVRPVAQAATAAASDAESRTRAALAAEGIRLIGLDIAGGVAGVRIANDRWSSPAQALGRAARILTATMPHGVGRFDLTLVEAGMPVTTASIARSDMETLEFDVDNAWSSLVRTRLDGAAPALDPLPGLPPRLSFGIVPHVAAPLFDGDGAAYLSAGIDLTARYEPAPGFVFSGTLRQRLLDSGDASVPDRDGPLPRVRSDAALYAEAGTTIPRLTAGWYGRPGRDLYGRVTAGYLEPMFAGVAGELLWAPPDSPLSLGAELAYAVRRTPDEILGVDGYEVVTGHLSAYYDFGNGFHGHLDAGRYLAGDWGATVALEREFGNGLRVGAFVTRTDVSFEDFGEGSFDKGLRLSIPLDQVLGRPTRERARMELRPVQGDGGARLDLDGRLYELVRDDRPDALRADWGRFWR